MYLILFILLFYMEEVVAMVPDWVNGLRSGEERFKLQNGTQTFFRQVGEDCEIAMRNVERDLEREFGMLVKYTNEITYEDERGCAVTISVGPHPAPLEVGIKSALLEKGRKAIKYAYVGLTRKEFVKYTKDKSPILFNEDINSHCMRAGSYKYESIHGMVHVCWKENTVQAFCVPKTDSCWKKKP